MSRDDWRALGWAGSGVMLPLYDEPVHPLGYYELREPEMAIRWLIACGAFNEPDRLAVHSRDVVGSRHDGERIEWAPPRVHVLPVHDGDPPDWYRDGMTQWPACEECDEPDSATCVYYGASGTARVCRDCDVELFTRGQDGWWQRGPVTRDDLVRRIAVLRRETHAGIGT